MAIFGDVFGGGSSAVIASIFAMIIFIGVIIALVKGASFGARLVGEVRKARQAAGDKSRRAYDEAAALRQAWQDSQRIMQDQQRDNLLLRAELAAEKQAMSRRDFAAEQARIKQLEAQAQQTTRDELVRVKDEVRSMRRALKDARRELKDTQKEIKEARKLGEPRLTAELQQELVREEQIAVSFGNFMNLGENELKQTNAEVKLHQVEQKIEQKPPTVKVIAKEEKLTIKEEVKNQAEAATNVGILQKEAAVGRVVAPEQSLASREMQKAMAEEQEAEFISRFENELKVHISELQNIMKEIKNLEKIAGQKMLMSMTDSVMSIVSTNLQQYKTKSVSIQQRMAILRAMAFTIQMMLIKKLQNAAAAARTQREEKIAEDLTKAVQKSETIVQLCNREAAELNKLLFA